MARRVSSPKSQKASKNSLKGRIRLGNAGARITVTANYEEFLKGANGGISLTEKRLNQMRKQVAEKIILPFYKRIILRTPVWQGTARMNWKFAVGRKVAGGRGVAADRSLIDPGLVKVSSKTGMGAMGSKFFLTQDPSMIGKKRKFSSGWKTGRATQMEFGKMTPAVKDMIRDAERLIMEHFGPSDKKAIKSNKRAPKLTSIRIFNPLNYVRFLEEEGTYGRTYKRGSTIWKEKEGAPPFVKTIGKYKPGYIGKALSGMQGSLTKRLDKDAASFKSSGRHKIVGDR